MVGGHKFFDRLEVKLVLDYLRIVDHPNHNDAIARVINVPSRKIGDPTIKGLLEEADLKKCTLWSLILRVAQGNTRASTTVSSQAQKGIEAFVSIILSCQKKLAEPATDTSSLTNFVTFVLRKICVEEYLKKSKPEDFDSRWANVEELVAQASDTAALEVNDDPSVFDSGPTIDTEATDLTVEESLSRFLANVALSTEVKKSADEGQPNGQVTLSTIHAAKGLEWPVVFIPATYEGSIPHSRAEDTDEERRLLYVAMTRAQALLYLSCPLKDSQGGKTELSKFLNPKGVRRMLAKSGPTLKFEAAEELAKILRRPCPKRVDVLTAYANEAHKEDNQWLRHEEDGDSDMEGGSLSDRDYPRYKRARPEDWTGSTVATRPERKTVNMFSGTTTMQDQTAYSVSRTSFVSAATLKIAPAADVAQENGDRKPPGFSRSTSAVSSASTKDKNGKRTTTRAAGQSSLTSFFTKPAAPTASPETENVSSIPPASKLKTPLHDISNVTVAPTPPERSHSNAETTLGQDHEASKPATTMHTTSIAMLRKPAMSPSRKTLGTRRAVTGGWAARMNR